MPKYNLLNTVTGEKKVEAMKIAEMEELISNSDWIVDITQGFPGLHSGIGLGVRKPDEGFRDLLSEMGKKHNKRGGKINDHR